MCCCLLDRRALDGHRPMPPRPRHAKDHPGRLDRSRSWLRARRSVDGDGGGALRRRRCPQLMDRRQQRVAPSGRPVCSTCPSTTTATPADTWRCCFPPSTARDGPPRATAQPPRRTVRRRPWSSASGRGWAAVRRPRTAETSPRAAG